MNVDDEEVMAMLTKLVIEQFTTELAAKARMFAQTAPPELSGANALEAFARAIESTNWKLGVKTAGGKH